MLTSILAKEAKPSDDLLGRRRPKAERTQVRILIDWSFMNTILAEYRLVGWDGRMKAAEGNGLIGQDGGQEGQAEVQGLGVRQRV